MRDDYFGVTTTRAGRRGPWRGRGQVGVRRVECMELMVKGGGRQEQVVGWYAPMEVVDEAVVGWKGSGCNGGNKVGDGVTTHLP